MSFKQLLAIILGLIGMLIFGFGLENLFSLMPQGSGMVVALFPTFYLIWLFSNIDHERKKWQKKYYELENSFNKLNLSQNTNKIISKLIKIGQKDQYVPIEEIKGLKVDQFYKIADKDFLIRAERLSLDSLIYLIKGLAITESELYKDWGAGSTTPTSKIYALIKLKIKNSKPADEVFQKVNMLKGWPLKNKTNPYIPIGYNPDKI